MDGNASIVLDVATVREAFPGWSIASSSGHWFAVRGGLVAEYGPPSVLRCYLRAPDLPQLTEKLGLHQYLDDLSPEQLAEVWERVMLPEDPS